MHVAINITPLESAHRLRGVGVYTKLLISALQKHESQNTYSFFTRTQKLDKNADLVHFPYFDPFFLTLPLIKLKPTIVTVHDVIPLVFPEKFPSGMKGRLRWEIQKTSLRGARRLIADSNTSKEDIARITGYPKTKIDTIYLAPTFASSDLLKKGDLQSARKRFSLPSKYILYVGDVNWNKNIRGLLEALAKVVSRSQGVKCIFVGKSFLDGHLAETQEINALVSKLELEPHIMRSGYVPDKQLAAMYGLAACLIQPSYYEGFGLPVLDAMRCGCPVVTSDVSSLAEIGGPSIRVQPDNSDSIALGIMSVLDMSGAKRTQIINEGYMWSEKFTWQKAAHETVSSYQRALI